MRVHRSVCKIVNCFQMSSLAVCSWHEWPGLTSRQAELSPGTSSSDTGHQYSMTPAHLRSEALNITIKWCKIRFWWCSVLECDWMIKLDHILIMIIMIITSSFIDPGRSSRLHPPCTGTHRSGQIDPEWKPWCLEMIRLNLFFESDIDKSPRYQRVLERELERKLKRELIRELERDLRRELDKELRRALKRERAWKVHAHKGFSGSFHLEKEEEDRSHAL